VTLSGKSCGSLQITIRAVSTVRQHIAVYLLDDGEGAVEGADGHRLSLNIVERGDVEAPQNADGADEDDLGAEVTSGADAAAETERVVALGENLVASKVGAFLEEAFGCEGVGLDVVAWVVVEGVNVREDERAFRDVKACKGTSEGI
jgi:hypothetical protein